MFDRRQLIKLAALATFSVPKLVTAAAPNRPGREAAPPAGPPLNELKPEVKFVLEGHTGKVFAAAFTHDGGHLVSGGDAAEMIVWDRRTGKETSRVKKEWLSDQVRELCCVAEKDRALIFAACRTLWGNGFGPKRVVLVLADKRESRALHFPFHAPLSPTCVAVSRPARFVAAGGEDRAVRVFDVAAATAAWAKDPNLREYGKEILPNAQALPNIVLAVVFHPSKPVLAVGCADGSIRLLDVAPNGIRQSRVVLEGHKAGVNCLTFTPDGSTLVSGDREGNVVLWDPANGRRNSKLPDARSGGIERIAISGDGRLLATAHRKNVAKLWDLRKLEELRTLERHTGPVMSLAFSPEGDQLVTAGEDFKVFLWDLFPTKQPQRAIRR